MRDCLPKSRVSARYYLTHHKVLVILGLIFFLLFSLPHSGFLPFGFAPTPRLVSRLIQSATSPERNIYEEFAGDPEECIIRGIGLRGVTDFSQSPTAIVSEC